MANTENLGHPRADGELAAQNYQLKSDVAQARSGSIIMDCAAMLFVKRSRRFVLPLGSARFRHYYDRIQRLRRLSSMVGVES